MLFICISYYRRLQEALDMLIYLTATSTSTQSMWSADNKQTTAPMHYFAHFVQFNVRQGGWYGWQPSSSSKSWFELFELILLLNLDKQLPVERFEAAVPQSTVPSPPLRAARRQHQPRPPATIGAPGGEWCYIYIYIYTYTYIYIY